MTFIIAASDPARRQPHFVDRHVGERMRLQRRALNMSQGALAERIGVTFQQVQKYERGANRISASKLYQVAEVLEAPVAFFFDGLPAPGHLPAPIAERDVHALLASPDGAAVARSFPGITSQAVRRAIISLLNSLARAETRDDD